MIRSFHGIRCFQHVHADERCVYSLACAESGYVLEVLQLDREISRLFCPFESLMQL